MRLAPILIPGGLNPVLVRELRVRMRLRRAFVILTVYLALLAGLTWLYLQIVTSAINQIAVQAGGTPSIFLGKSTIVGVSLIELSLLCFITPTLTAGALASERERQTYDLLLATPLAARTVVFGKLLAALAYVTLLVLVGLPLQILAILFGGVTVGEVALAVAVLLATGLTYTALGLFFSVIIRSSLGAAIASYVVIALLVIGTAVVATSLGTVQRQPPPEWILWGNPYYGLTSALVTEPPSGTSLPEGWLPWQPGWPAWQQSVTAAPSPRPEALAAGPGAEALVRSVAADPGPNAPLWSRLTGWGYYLLTSAAATILLVGASILFVRPRRGWQLKA